MTVNEQKPPINGDTEICKIISSLPEKFVVDFANGIDVTRDHIRVQRQRDAFFSRMYDGFTGQGAQRQLEINASLADGVEGALIWLTDLTESLAHSNFAIAKVNERVGAIMANVTHLANYSANTRDMLSQLSKSLEFKIEYISERILKIEAKQDASIHIDQVFNKWAAGRFSTFAPAGRCYAALEELRWGAFGDFYLNIQSDQARQSFLNDLANRMIQQLRIDTNQTSAKTRLVSNTWLYPPKEDDIVADSSEALAYIGSWSNPDTHPFIYSISQAPKTYPIAMPKLCSAERLAEAVVSEVFS